MSIIYAYTYKTPRYLSVAAEWSNTVSLVAEYAEQALLTELMLTPKPGLVDRRNSGALHDMSLQKSLISAGVMADWWPRFVDVGYASAHIPAHDFLPVVRPTGVLCEEAMMRATAGVNTHKGAIFSLGLLCAAAGRLVAQGIALGPDRLCTEVASICVGLVERELDATQERRTAGERVFKRHRLTGARGEAASGYAIVRRVALPVYQRLRLDGIREEVALLQVLLRLLAFNNDGNLVARAGLTGLHYVRAYAQELLREGGVLTPDGVDKMAAFDDELIARQLDPRGSANLLAVTWFLAQLPTVPEVVQA